MTNVRRAIGTLVSTFLVLFSVTAIAPAKARAEGLMCAQSFERAKKTRAKRIGFTQDFIGHEWALYKVEKLEKEFSEWKEETGKKSKEEFVLEKTKKKPLPVIVDIHGVERLIDNHHGFFAITWFLGGGRSFDLHTEAVRDYRKLNPETMKRYSKKEMMADMIANHYTSFSYTSRPRYKDLKRLPRKIEKMPDLPVRSLISFIFASFEVPLKGKDFTPQIQNDLAKLIVRLGIEPFAGEPFSEHNIQRLRGEFESRPEILEFLIERLGNKTSKERQQKVREFLEGLLESAQR